eukprot:6207471-Pleurochrysis_carterae.AAC.1
MRTSPTPVSSPHFLDLFSRFSRALADRARGRFGGGRGDEAAEKVRCSYARAGESGARKTRTQDAHACTRVARVRRGPPGESAGGCFPLLRVRECVVAADSGSGIVAAPQLPQHLARGAH